tara:strand:- start:2971 stop:3252 length:282 start_codon:yes stop_codon:yes gene_type:complete
VSFWVELKVHRLKSLKSIKLSPHQIAWQTRYSRENGLVVNLVAHPSSQTINIFLGKRSMQLVENDCPCTPDWSSPNDFKGAVDFIIAQNEDPT